MAPNTASQPAQTTAVKQSDVTTSTAQQATTTAASSFWTWFGEYLNAIIGIAALGGQITFTVIVSDIADPSTLHSDIDSSNHEGVIFPKEKVRFLIALSWLFFTATLGLAVVAKILFANGPPGPGCAISRRRRWFDWLYATLTLLLNALPIAAFLLLALATSAYVPVVGWLGVGFIAVFGLFVLILWFVLDAGML
ncbi:hypothetical protein V8F20_012683 [Naviculisporaceae sp. PSN 640]